MNSSAYYKKIRRTNNFSQRQEIACASINFLNYLYYQIIYHFKIKPYAVLRYFQYNFIRDSMTGGTFNYNDYE